MSDKPKAKSKSKSKEKKTATKKSETKTSSKSKSKSKDKKKDNKKDKSPKSTLKTSKSKKSISKSNIDDNKSEINEELTKNLLPNLQPQQQPEVQSLEKCEGCFQGDAFCFCSTCGKLYCKICDDQLHIVPAYRHHERTSLMSLQNMNATCYHHGHPLRYYCESCDDPICALCKTQGPHNTPLHRVDSLFEVYRKKLSSIKHKVDNDLLSKSSKIESLMLQIENIIKETKQTSKRILQGINAEYESIVDNLGKTEGKKLAMLNYSSVNIQKDLVSVNNIINTLNTNYDSNNSYTTTTHMQNEEHDYISFLLKYKSLSEQIDSLITKPCASVSLSPQDKEQFLKWPEELNTSKQKLLDHPKLKTLLKIKDDIIWHLLTTPYEDKSPELEEIHQRTQREIAEWSKLSDKYASELKKYNMVCTFCGCYLDNVKINEHCRCNKDKEIPSNDYTKHKPPFDTCGNNRHFFSEPTEEYENKLKQQMNRDKALSRDTSEFILASSDPDNKKKVREKLLADSFSNEWVFKIARVVEKEKINLFQVLNAFDVDGDGFIDLNDLLNGLKQIEIVLDDREVEGMRKYVALTNQGGDKIDVKQFAMNFMRRKSKAELENIMKVSSSVDKGEKGKNDNDDNDEGRRSSCVSNSNSIVSNIKVVSLPKIGNGLGRSVSSSNIFTGSNYGGYNAYNAYNGYGNYKHSGIMKLGGFK